MAVILAWSSFAIGVAGFCYGVYQNRTKARISRMARQQAWANYQTTANALGFFQDYMKKDKPPHTRLFGQAHARLDEAYQKAIQNLVLNYDRVTPDMVARWIEQGRLKDYDDGNFRRHLIDESDA